MGSIQHSIHTSSQLTPVAVVGAALVVTVAVVAAGRLVSADASVQQDLSSTMSTSDGSTSSAQSAQSQSSAQPSDQMTAPTESDHDTTEVHTSVVSSGESGGQSTVTINGTQYTAPAGSSLHHSEVSDDGQTRVDVNISNQNSTGGSSQSTHTNINTQSYSSTTQFHSGGQ